MKYNTKYVYSEKNEYSSYRKNKKFCSNKETFTEEHSGFDKETLNEYLIHLFDVFIDDESNVKKPEKNDIEFYYGVDRPDFDSLLNYYNVRYDLYIDFIKKIEELENYSCNTMYTIHFNKNNCKFFNDNKNEFVESYLTVRVEKDQR